MTRLQFSNKVKFDKLRRIVSCLQKTSEILGESSMNIETSVAIAVLFFVLLVITLIITLIQLQKLLSKVDHVLSNTERKMNSLDPTLNAIADVGEMLETKTKKIKKEREIVEAYEELAKSDRKIEAKINHQETFTSELVDWLVVSIKLGEKFFNRR